MSADLRALEAEVIRREALNDILAFQRVMSHTGALDFAHVPVQHMAFILRKCQDFIEGRFPGKKILAISAPPGSGKTISLICVGLWFLAKFPDRKIMRLTHTAGLSEDINRRSRNAALHPIFADVAGCGLDPDHQGVEYWSTLRGGGMRAFGSEAATAGVRSDLTICDDLVKGLEIALNPAALQKLWNQYKHEIEPRLTDVGLTIHIGTRWAQEDPIGMLLAERADTVEFVNLPLEAEPGDPLGREPGAILWPERYTPEFIAEKKKDDLLYSTLYLNRPVNVSGSWVERGEIHKTRNRPVGETTKLLCCDIALKPNAGDWRCFMLLEREYTGRIYVTDVVRNKLTPEKCVDALFDLVFKHQPSEVLFDDDNSSILFLALLREAMKRPKQGHRPFPWKMLPLRGQSKVARATSIRAHFKRHNVLILDGEPWTQPLVDEILNFSETARVDDQIDCLSLGGRRFADFAIPEAPDSVKRQQAMQALAEMPGRVTYDPQAKRYVLQTNLNELFEDRATQRARTRRYE